MRRPQPVRPVLVTAMSLVLIGIGNVLAFALTVPGIEAGSYMFGITVYCMVAPILRLPFRTTLTAAFLITVGGLALAAGYAAGPASRLIAGPNATLPVITLVVIPVMALLTERALRQRFADELVIERQRQQLEESRQLIRRYAPSSVVSHIEQGDRTVDSPLRRKVTDFFSDVVGFTAMADRVDPEALAEIVNDYLGSLANLIERHGGTLNEFAGDGVMAIFGAPDEMDAAVQVHAAVAAAQELQASLPAWSAGWYQHGIVEDARARIGINTGTVSVGTFGSTVRATYTGIGIQTNIAARVQAEARPGGILLSNTSWHLVKDTIACEPRGEVMVKGVHFPIELYEPVAL
jgi:class 3 adenylate cyclase